MSPKAGKEAAPFRTVRREKFGICVFMTSSIRPDMSGEGKRGAIRVHGPKTSKRYEKHWVQTPFVEKLSNMHFKRLPVGY
jgi:hypothetical protein